MRCYKNKQPRSYGPAGVARALKTYKKVGGYSAANDKSQHDYRLRVLWGSMQAVYTGFMALGGNLCLTWDSYSISVALIECP